jgi:hypothetical protein
MHLYDRRLRWSVPAGFPRGSRAHRRRAGTAQQIPALSLSTDTLLVHFGMTGSLRAFASRRRAVRTTTSTSSSIPA